MKNKQDTFVIYLCDQMAELPSLSWKKMFGGYGMYSEGCFFAIMFDDRLYFKTDSTTEAAFRERGMQAFRPRPDQCLRNYLEVPPDVVEDPDSLCRWARAAIDVARNAR